MARKQENRKKYLKNPHKTNIIQIPESFGQDQTFYLQQLQNAVSRANSIKNEKGNDIPIRIKNGKIQFYEKDTWKDSTGETVVNNTTITNVSSGGSSSSSSESESSSSSGGSSSASDVKAVINEYLLIDNAVYDEEEERPDEDLRLKWKYRNFNAGENITLTDPTETDKAGTISAVDTTYTAGTNITIDSSDNNKISAVDTTYSGDETTIHIDSSNVISSLQTVPTKTSELINDSGFITNSYHDATKQDTLTAGSGIDITNNIISATGGGGVSEIATDTLNNKLESYLLRGEVVNLTMLNTLLENKINGVI